MTLITIHDACFVFIAKWIGRLFSLQINMVKKAGDVIEYI